MDNKPQITPTLNAINNPLSGKQSIQLNLQFAIDDVVYFLKDAKIVRSLVFEISVTIGRYTEPTVIKYHVKQLDSDNPVFISKGDGLFKTKELLISSL